MSAMRRRSATWLLAACLMGVFVTEAPAGTAMEDAYEAFRTYRGKCTDQHGYDPDNLPPLADFEVAPGEADWRSCVYRGIQEILIPKTAFPDLYRNLVATDQRLAQQVRAGQLTRQERRTLVEQLIADIKTTESAHAGALDQAKTDASEQQRRDFTRRMVNDLRGFTR